MAAAAGASEFLNRNSERGTSTTENEDHAAWLVGTKVGLPLERVTVWAGRDA